MNNDPNASTGLSLSFLTVVALGFPAVFALVWNATQNPTQAILLMIVYGLVVGLVGFIGGVWQRLQALWVDDVTKKTDTWFRNRFAGRHLREYLLYLYYQNRTFDVRGLGTQGPFSLELPRIYVQLRLMPDIQVSSNPIQSNDENADDGEIIWDYINSVNVHNIVILGAPGTGKTTLIKHIVLTLLTKKDRRLQNAPNFLPVLLLLRDHSKQIDEDPNVKFVDLVRKSLDMVEDRKPPVIWFEKYLSEGKCLILLDGLDEIGEESARSAVVKWVDKQMLMFNNNRFVVTSRPYGYINNQLSQAQVAVLKIQPLNSVEVREFISNWYLANEIMSHQKNDPGVEFEAKNGSEGLLKRIRNAPDLADLAVNPLLLTMISTVHRYRSSLPERRVELYNDICEVFLGKRQLAKEIEGILTPSQKQSVLQPLAFEMMKRKVRDITLEDALKVIRKPLDEVKPNIDGSRFIRNIENESGLLIERERGIYSFSHRTFQEYLAASHVQEEKLENELINFVQEDWWQETIRLYSARGDATHIVEACLTDHPPQISKLVLAIRCVEEARKIQASTRTKLERILEEGVEDADPTRRKIIAEALLDLHLHEMIRFDDNRYVGASYISNAEYQLFVDTMAQKRQYFHPDQWIAADFPRGQGIRPVKGIRSADALEFCKWLTARTTSEWKFRLPLEAETDSHSKIVYWVLADDEKVIISEPCIKNSDLVDALSGISTPTYFPALDFDSIIKTEMRLTEARNCALRYGFTTGNIEASLNMAGNVIELAKRFNTSYEERTMYLLAAVLFMTILDQRVAKLKKNAFETQKRIVAKVFNPRDTILRTIKDLQADLERFGEQISLNDLEALESILISYDNAVGNYGGDLNIIDFQSYLKSVRIQVQGTFAAIKYARGTNTMSERLEQWLNKFLDGSQNKINLAIKLSLVVLLDRNRSSSDWKPPFDLSYRYVKYTLKTIHDSLIQIRNRKSLSSETIDELDLNLSWCAEFYAKLNILKKRVDEELEPLEGLRIAKNRFVEL